MLYQFLSNLIASITTTAGGLVKNYWAGVQNLQTPPATQNLRGSKPNIVILFGDGPCTSC